MIKKVKEVKLKEGDSVTPHINSLLSEFITDSEVRAIAEVRPFSGITEDGKKYMLWFSGNVAIFVVRKDKDHVSLGLLKSNSVSEVTSELQKYGIAIQGFGGSADTYWSDMRSCLFAALNIEDTDERDKPEEPEEREEREEPESRERPEEPEIPFETVDFEGLDDNVGGYLKTSDSVERAKQRGQPRKGQQNNGGQGGGDSISI